jgi:dienelactone hydrolase
VREDVTFPAGDGRCAAWLYHPENSDDNVPCVVMAHGFSLTRHEALAPYAERFAAAGLAVLVFDYRHFGDSPGEPRGRLRVRRQREDWRAAIAYARSLPGVDPRRLVLWGFSSANIYVLGLAATQPDGIAAVLAVEPFVDGLRRALATRPRLTAWIVPRALADAVGRHTTIPVTAPPGRHGAMTLPGECDGFAAAVAPGSPWRNRISPAVFLIIAALRPVRYARRIAAPLWVGLGDRDITVSRQQVGRLAERAPRAELKRYDWDHFGPFVGDGPARVATDQVAFLVRQGLARPREQ